MPDEKRGSGANWRPGVGEELQWRRRVVLRGPMPIEIRSGRAMLGSLRALNRLGTRYRAEIAPESWVFSRSFRQNWCAAHHEGSGLPVARADRTGFRRKRVELASGETFEWRQRGWSGRRYELRWVDGRVLMTALNTGGPLRWNGKIALTAPAIELGKAGLFLVPFGLFLVFNSSELHL